MNPLIDCQRLSKSGQSEACATGLAWSSSRPMPTQWIAAHVARKLVINPHSEWSEMLALCGRAHAGMVRTNARLLIVGDDRSENTPIPPAFWWAEGHEALHQNWATGDFSTWIDRSVHWQAFGMSFALDDVLEMLPVEQRAIADSIGTSVSAWPNGGATNSMIAGTVSRPKRRLLNASA